jgi:hypothetical protein
VEYPLSTQAGDKTNQNSNTPDSVLGFQQAQGPMGPGASALPDMTEEQITKNRQGDEQPKKGGLVLVVQEREGVVLMETSLVQPSQSDLSGYEQPDGRDGSN